MSWGWLKQNSWRLQNVVKGVILSFGWCGMYTQMYTHRYVYCMYTSAHISTKKTNWNQYAHTFACLFANWLKNEHKRHMHMHRYPSVFHAASVAGLFPPCISFLWSLQCSPKLHSYLTCRARNTYFIPTSTLWYRGSFFTLSLWPHEVDQILICVHLMTPSNAKIYRYHTTLQVSLKNVNDDDQLLKLKTNKHWSSMIEFRRILLLLWDNLRSWTYRAEKRPMMSLKISKIVRGYV